MRITSRIYLPELSFRTIVGNFFYFECPDILEENDFADMPQGTTGEIIYGYIDPEAGLSFQACCYATRTGDDITIAPERQQYGLILRYGFVKNYELACIDFDFTKDEPSRSFKKIIDENYAPEDEVVLTLRQMAFLDPFRNDEFPDDLRVRLLREGLDHEEVWIRPNTIQGDEIFGELLNQPYADFGVNSGDQIQIIPYEQENGELICISIF